MVAIQPARSGLALRVRTVCAWPGDRYANLHDWRENMAFVDDLARYNRAAIMAEARRVHRMTRARGVTFRDALRFAWSRAREARKRRLDELRAFERLHTAA